MKELYDVAVEYVKEKLNTPEFSMEMAFVDGAEYEKHLWIPVTEELPDDLTYVIVRTETDGYDVGFLFNGKWKTKAGKVTHWKPLYKIKQDENTEEE